MKLQATLDAGRLAPSAARRPGDVETTSWPLRIVDGALAGTIFVLPFVMGGRHPWGELLLVLLATLAATAWMAHRVTRPTGRWVWTWAEPVLLAGAILVLLQLVSLSESLHQTLSPHVAEVLPLWTSSADSSAAQGVWSQISLAPEATRGGLAIYLAYVMLFVIAVQRMRRLSDVERLLQWIACLAAAMATFGIVQYLTSNGKFLWIYQHPFRDTLDRVKGSFVNHNHFAHLLALGIGPILWWIQRTLRDPASAGGERSSQRTFPSPSKRKWEIALPIAALAVVLLAGLMSLSRGGAGVMLAATLVCLGIYYRARLIRPRLILGIGGAACLVVAGLSTYGLTQVSERLDDITAGSVEQLDSNSVRRDVWAAVASAIPDYWIAGSGVGSHQYVVPMYLEKQREFDYSHAENSYLQLALETGLPGAALALCGIALCFYWCLGGLLRTSSDRITAALGAVAASLVASLAHSLVDFPWYIVGCMAITTLLLACCYRLWYFARDTESAADKQYESAPAGAPRARLAYGAALLAVVAVGGWTVQNRFGPAMAAPYWDQYLRLSVAAQLEDEQIDAQFAKLGDKAKLPSFAERHKLNRHVVERKHEALQQVLRWNPNDGRAQLRMAKVYLSRFTLAQKKAKNSMPLSQIRDAAIRSADSFRQMGEKTLAEHDANGDGVLETSEVSAAEDLDELAARADSIDANGDGRLDADELGRHHLDAWLRRAIGPAGAHLDEALRHTRESLRLLPLEGSSYLFLANMSFLTGSQASQASKQAFLDQALTVRPYDGNVLFGAGQEALLDRGLEAALVYWKKSFYTQRRNQRQLVDMLYTLVPPEFFLKEFEPDLPASRLIYSRYRTILSPQQLSEFSLHYARLVEEKARASEHASRLWLECYRLYDSIGDEDNTIRCAQAAVQSNPNHYYAHYVYGMRLMALQRFDEAERHIRWCVQRKPDDDVLRGTLERISINRLKQKHGIESASKSKDAARR